ncbi:MAG TPA: 6-phosphogluconolactonase [Candidatus Lumbricidophila sp.]|nr:6-phosphogluconolactonase [Candidatus Lumbricidophila sp.]
MSDRHVVVAPTRDALVTLVAERFIGTITDVLEGQPEAHIALTGGTVGIAVLAELGHTAHTLDWSRIHLWWGDERWVAADSVDRNDGQALRALAPLGIPADRIHRFAAADSRVTLDQAAVDAANELAQFGSAAQPYPSFDVAFLGVGPDGHIASLFPGLPGIDVTDSAVIAVRSSPKPPPERLSLTLPVLNAAQRVWLVLGGADKAQALGEIVREAAPCDIPAAGVAAAETVIFADQDAAAEVPAHLR